MSSGTDRPPAAETMGPLPETSLIITAHRHGPMLEKCLDAVAALDPASGEAIVVVDGNDQAVAKSVQRRGLETIVLPNAPGVSAARNAGAARAKGIFLLFLDSDVVPRRDHVAKAVSALGTIPGAVAAFGCYDDSPAAPGVVSRYRNLLHHFTHFHANREAQYFWAACGICEAGVFREAGGFDESYRAPSIEDIALGYKIRRSGHRIALDPSWQVKHLKQWIWRDLVVTDIARRAIPWTLLLLREGRLDNDLNIDTRSLSEKKQRRTRPANPTLEGRLLPCSHPARCALRATCGVLPRHRPVPRLCRPTPAAQPPPPPQKTAGKSSALAGERISTRFPQADFEKKDQNPRLDRVQTLRMCVFAGPKLLKKRQNAGLTTFFFLTTFSSEPEFSTNQVAWQPRSTSHRR